MKKGGQTNRTLRGPMHLPPVFPGFDPIATPKASRLPQEKTYRVGLGLLLGVLALAPLACQSSSSASTGDATGTAGDRGTTGR